MVDLPWKDRPLQKRMSCKVEWIASQIEYDALHDGPTSTALCRLAILSECALRWCSASRYYAGCVQFGQLG